jgi:hypothetical protein
MDLQSESTTNLSDNAQIASGSVLSLKPESGHFTHEIGQSLKKINLQDDPIEFIAGMFPKGKVSALVGESGKEKAGSYLLWL